MTQNKQEQDAFLQWLDGDIHAHSNQQQIDLKAQRYELADMHLHYEEALKAVRAKYLELKPSPVAEPVHRSDYWISPKCETCSHMKIQTLSNDESGGGSTDAWCSKGHWHGLGRLTGPAPAIDPFGKCTDYTPEQPSPSPLLDRVGEETPSEKAKRLMAEADKCVANIKAAMPGAKKEFQRLTGDGASSFHPESALMRGTEPLPLGQQETKFYCTRKYCSPCKEQCSGCAEEFKSLGQQEGEVPEDSPSDEEVIKTLIEANAGLQEHIDHMEGKLAEKMDFIDELQSERKADAERIADLEKEVYEYRNLLEDIAAGAYYEAPQEAARALILQYSQQSKTQQ